MTNPQVADTTHGPVIPETDRDPAPVVGLDVDPPAPVMADGREFPDPMEGKQ